MPLFESSLDKAIGDGEQMVTAFEGRRYSSLTFILPNIGCGLLFFILASVMYLVDVVHKINIIFVLFVVIDHIGFCHI